VRVKILYSVYMRLTVLRSNYHRAVVHWSVNQALADDVPVADKQLLQKIEVQNFLATRQSHCAGIIESPTALRLWVWLFDHQLRFIKIRFIGYHQCVINACEHIFGIRFVTMFFSACRWQFNFLLWWSTVTLSIESLVIKLTHC